MVPFSTAKTTPLDLAKLKQELPDLSLEVPRKYARMLNTNYVPTASELHEIQAFSSAITSKTQEIASEIASLEGRLSKLKSRQAFLKDAAAPYAALASPFRRFPPELMQSIFIACLPDSRNAVMHRSEAPVLLGRVCSEWRRIVLNTPALWSTLHIVPPNFSADMPELNTIRFRRKREVIETWLGRSGACPLSISFVWFGSDGEAETRLCGELLGLLIQLSKRWKRIELQLPLKMLKPFLGLGREDVPLLEVLSLTDNRSNFEDFDEYVNSVGSGNDNLLGLAHWPEQLQFASEAPSLKSLDLTFFAGAIQIPSTVAWSQLTTLVLESNISFFFKSCEDLILTLGQCSALESCTLKLPLSLVTPMGIQQAGGNVPQTYTPVDSVVTLPELRELCVDGDQHLLGAFHMTTIISNIRAPKLREIAIYGRAGSKEFFDDDGDGDEDDDSSTDADDGSEAPTPASTIALPPNTTSENTTTSQPRPRYSPEPIAGLKKLLIRSGCPLEVLRLESVPLVEKEFLACLRLAPTITTLVIRDYKVRIGLASRGYVHCRNVGDGAGKECMVDRVLKALIVERRGLRGWYNGMEIDVGEGSDPDSVGDDEVHDHSTSSFFPSSPTSSCTMVEDGDTDSDLMSAVSPASTSVEIASDDGHTHLDIIGDKPSLSRVTRIPKEANSRYLHQYQDPLLPNLTSFDFALPCGSQELFCAFVESRFLPDEAFDLPPTGIQQIVDVPVVRNSNSSSSFERTWVGVEGVDANPPFFPPELTDLEEEYIPPSVVELDEPPNRSELAALPFPMSISPGRQKNRHLPFEITEPLSSPPSIARLSSVKCAFTAQENGIIRERLARLREMGLDIGVTFHTPLSDEVTPSPWTGVEGLL
ncbi:hypothetical protein CC1G_04778 [Coprinopsis cinerea okayama7|uniref:Uncharacterized protein n=1 Tax=Coprinopsis cinerea (strain Okayama-7 / 130 / ATCC MYA-4618 / FGSC 9003) TaxID=240176 RepID=A8P2J2_COPC7|nr:hypothetical protein CC1G_04778 [Coprinopsis cinerea okayama7\|eukprot:XP_001838334.1 hypothetical protein CC1G_04778 [Coprinopsis cinerea okayama7\